MRNIKFPLMEDMSGELITDLHILLWSLNYQISKEELIRSYFGASTKYSVKQFQEKNGIAISGIVDKKTSSLLNDIFIHSQDKKRPFRSTILKTNNELNPLIGQLQKFLTLYKKIELNNPIGIEDRHNLFGKDTRYILNKLSSDQNLNKSDFFTNLMVWANEFVERRFLRRQFLVIGRIINKQLLGVSDLIVEAWDKDRIGPDDKLGETITDEAGWFIIEFDSDDSKEWIFDKRPDLYFKVYMGEELIKDTEGQVMCNIFEQEQELVIQVDIEEGEPAEDPYIVRGEISDDTDTIDFPIQVVAYDRDLRREVVLGSDTVNLVEEQDENVNRYEIQYFLSQLSRPDKAAADLFIRVLGPNSEVLAQSETIFRAAKEEVINLRIEDAYQVPQVSEYELVEAVLAPVLGELSVENLSEDERNYVLQTLSAQDEVSITLIEVYLAHGPYIQETGLAGEFFYGYRRQTSLDVMPSLEELLGLDPELIEGAIQESNSQNIIPSGSESELPIWMSQWQQYKLDENILNSLLIAVRLLNAGTQEALEGYQVNLNAFDGSTFTNTIASGTTDGRGLVGFTIILKAGSEEEFAFEVLQNGNSIYTENHTVQRNFQEIQILVPAQFIPKPPSLSISDLTDKTGLQLPDELSDFLLQNNIRTMDDILLTGGLGQLGGIPVPVDDPILVQLEAHAQHSLLWDKTEENQVLIDNGYVNIQGIAKTTLATFQNDLIDQIGEYQLYLIHAAARHSDMALTNIITDKRIRLLNGESNASSISNNNSDLRNQRTLALLAPGETLEDEFPESNVCECDEGDSAVGPLAYLADLLDYVLDHVKVVIEEKDPPEKNIVRNITTADLESRFLQSFPDLPASRELVSTQYCRLRAIIELLRVYYQRKLSSGEINRLAQERFIRDEIRFAKAGYQRLLEELGTNYAELRLARFKKAGETEEEFELRKQELSQKIGIDLYEDPSMTSNSRLDEIYQDVNLRGIANPTEGVTEDFLELTFGLRDTRRDTLDITPQRKVLAWRLDYLRTLWRKQDFVEDDYSLGKLPVIDPDLIGVDDLRSLEPDDPTIKNPIYDLWVHRRRWIDDLILNPPNLNNQDFDQLLERMYSDFSYTLGTGEEKIVPWSSDLGAEEFQGVLRVLQNEGKEEFLKEEKRLKEKLALTVEAFIRLMELYNKYQAIKSESPTENPYLNQDEWEEVRNILAQVVKERFYELWVIEEQTSDPSNPNLPIVFFSPYNFWKSLTEVEQGSWSSQILETEHPLFEPGVERAFLDPELIERDDLPDITAGKKALDLWDVRHQKLGQIEIQLREAFINESFDDFLQLAVGDPGPGDALPHDLDLLIQQRSSDIPSEMEEARLKIEQDFRLTLADFDWVVLLRAKVNSGSSLDEEEVDELISILVSARKLKHEYENWLDEEKSIFDKEGERAYWKMRKARLPKWRAGFTERALWQFALEQRSQSPIIDPDVLRIEDFKSIDGSTAIGQAFEIYEARRLRINKELVNLQRIWGTKATSIDDFNAIVLEKLGIDPDLFDVLKNQLIRGEDIRARLTQLNLNLEAFEFLRIMHEILLNSGSLSQSSTPIAEDRLALPNIDSEQKQVVAIVVRASKERLFREWQLEELSTVLGTEPVNLTHSQDFFTILEIPFDTFPLPEPIELTAWLTQPRDRNRWQRKLKGRIEQEETSIEAYKQIILDTEEQVLGGLRDALITVIDEKAKDITNQLQIDVEDNTCQPTTRASLAIEVLQGILHSIYTGQLEDTYPELELDAPSFEEEWKWIGSYASWRAAMFVFLYPENVLLPSLRRHQTPAFEKLVKAIRNNRRLDAELACELAQEYSSYFEDICSLKVKSTCQTYALLDDGICRNGTVVYPVCIYFQFALAKKSKKVYWSFYRQQDKSGFSNSFWNHLEEVSQPILEVIGSPVYRISNEERFIVLFIKYVEGIFPKLGFVRFNLSNMSWEGGLQELSLPGDSTEFIVKVKQSFSQDYPPQVFIQTFNGTNSNLKNNIFQRSLNSQLTGWNESNDGGEWESRILIKSTGISSVGTLSLVAAFNNNSYALVFNPIDLVAGTNPNFIPIVFARLAKAVRYSGWLIKPGGILLNAIPLGQSIAIVYRSGRGNEYEYRLLQDVLELGTEVVIPEIDPPFQWAWRDENISSSYGSELVSNISIRIITSNNSRVIRRGFKYPITALTQSEITEETQISPYCKLGYKIPEILSEQQNKLRKKFIKESYEENNGVENFILEYLAELFYFVPIQLAFSLSQRKQYNSSLNYLKTVYDYSQPLVKRKIYYGLEKEEFLSEGPTRNQKDLSSSP